MKFRSKAVAIVAAFAVGVGLAGVNATTAQAEQVVGTFQAPVAPNPVPGQKSNIKGMPDIPALSSAQVAEGLKVAAAINAKVADAKAKGLTQVAGTEHLLAPVPPSKAAKLATCTSWPTAHCRHYLKGDQTLTDLARGVSATMTTNKPFVQNTGGNCEHSLAQLSAHAESEDDLVEVGWQVSPCRRADGTPILFGSAWNDGVWLGYDAAGGWIDNAAQTPNLGAGLGNPANHTYVLDATSTDIWIGWQAGWIARLPKVVFTGGTGLGAPGDSFKKIQGFWEVATMEQDPCTDFGSGVDSNPVAPTTGKIGSFTLIGSADAVNITNVQRLNPGGVVYVNDNRAAITETPANELRGGGPMYGDNGVPTVGTSGTGCAPF